MLPSLATAHPHGHKGDDDLLMLLLRLKKETDDEHVWHMQQVHCVFYTAVRTSTKIDDRCIRYRSIAIEQAARF